MGFGEGKLVENSNRETRLLYSTKRDKFGNIISDVGKIAITGGKRIMVEMKIFV